MAKKKKDAIEEPIEGVENLLSKTENYIEENQKSLTIIVTAIVLVVLGYLGYTNLYVAPMEREARSQIYMAERYFERDSFYLALYGDGNYPGFVDIIDDYALPILPILRGSMPGYHISGLENLKMPSKTLPGLIHVTSLYHRSPWVPSVMPMWNSESWKTLHRSIPRLQEGEIMNSPLPSTG
jgi:hypothetical protein